MRDLLFVLSLAHALLASVPSFAEAQIVVVEQRRPPPPPPPVVYEPVWPRLQAGLALAVPVWATEDGVVDSGIGVQGRLGWDIGVVVPELGAGTMVHWVETVGDDEPLDSWWVSGGVRLQLPNSSGFVPFVSGALQVNAWGATVDQGVYVDTDSYHVTFGIVGSAGLMIEVDPAVAVELGVSSLLTTPGDVFDDHEVFVTPFLGGTLLL